MGLPTRLHGDIVVDFIEAVTGFCPKCISIKEWEVICENGKYYKRCVKCGQKREINDSELQNLVAKAKAKKVRKTQEKSKGK